MFENFFVAIEQYNKLACLSLLIIKASSVSTDEVVILA
jgi:hypothetical protein